ncbi:MAG TPA: hypothetical protein VGQ76_26895 [Thermoanaerobaculia bacterium]|nr:hypothetical protein [Thermoanaerobaculia bacterium]
MLIDLDGGGISTSGIDSPVEFFDSNGDGVRESSSWTGHHTGDAFLWMDLNGDDAVTPGELFGSGMPLPNGTNATNGFSALAIYDLPQYGGDGNGVINRDDEVWRSLRLWVDRNHDGGSKRKEISRPRKAGIIEFGLDRIFKNTFDGRGNSVMLAGNYKMKIKIQGVPFVGERAMVDIAFIPIH